MPNDRRFQISLRMLVLSQLIAGCILFLNFFSPIDCRNEWYYFGWPFRSFGKYLGTGPLQIFWDAVYANVLVWLTLVAFPILYRWVTRRSSLSFLIFGTAFIPASFGITSFLTYETLDAGMFWEQWIGFPFNVCLVSSGDYYFLGWRYLTLDLYAWTACYLVVWWIATFARNKFRRKETA